MFQFTHPGRGATEHVYSPFQSKTVSIHAPREGCDGLQAQSEEARESFNSRTPGGVRLVPDSDYSAVGMFQFTHPGRGATGRMILQMLLHTHMFQFTHPGRGATVWCKVAYYGADKQA